MKCFWIVLTVFVCSATANAQSTEDSIKNVINNLFLGMKNADPALLKTCFSDSMVLQTITNRGGKVAVRNEKASEFIDFVSQQKPGVADERIQFEMIRVDGPMASVWTPYHFYMGGKFSHCGVNTFVLVRLNGDWKIQYLIDTRRRDGCKPE